MTRALCAFSASLCKHGSPFSPSPVCVQTLRLAQSTYKGQLIIKRAHTHVQTACLDFTISTCMHHWLLLGSLFQSIHSGFACIAHRRSCSKQHYAQPSVYERKAYTPAPLQNSVYDAPHACSVCLTSAVTCVQRLTCTAPCS